MTDEELNAAESSLEVGTFSKGDARKALAEIRRLKTMLNSAILLESPLQQPPAALIGKAVSKAVLEERNRLLEKVCDSCRTLLTGTP